ncbi:MAG: hypothetical protein L3K23_06930 [Thermoplasmata archaeon]|nr:hypothetical protein [Thermoplasmata archaeon]
MSLLLLVLVGSTRSSVEPSQVARGAPVDNTSPAPVAVLNAFGAMGSLAPTFWGINYDINEPQTNFENATLSEYLNATPIRFVRDVLQWSNASLQSADRFDRWSGSQSEVTIDWNLTDSPGQDVAEVRALESTYGVHATFWAYGNEPATKGVSALAYARNLQSFISGVRSFDPAAKFVGLETQVPNGQGTPYIFNVSKVDGANISAISIHTYPNAGTSGSLEQDFLNSLYAPWYDDSVVQGANLAWATIKAACGSCGFQLFVGEVNGGPDSPPYDLYAPYRAGYDEAVFYAASVIQAWQANVSRFVPWTLAAPVEHKCDNGVFELDALCGGIHRVANPAFYFFSSIANQLPPGTLFNASVSGAPHVYAAEDVSGSTRWAFLVNANLTNTYGFELGQGFSGLSPVVTVSSLRPEQFVVATTFDQNLTSSPVISLGPMQIMLVKLSNTSASAPRPYAPAAPTDLRLTGVGSTGTAVAWANPPGSLTSNTFYLASGTACGSWNVRVALPVSTSYLIAGLSPSTAYCAAVSASNSSGASAWSNSVTFRTVAIPPGPGPRRGPPPGLRFSTPES